jgi:hypothetical protein
MRIVIRLVVYAAIVMALVACGSGSSGSSSKGIVGKWKLSKMTVDGQASHIGPGESVYEFFDDGSWSLTGGSGSAYKGTYTFRENGQLVTTNQVGKVETYNATIDGNTLTLDNPGLTVVLERV